MEAYEIVYYFFRRDENGILHAAQEFRQIFNNYEMAREKIATLPRVIYGFKGQEGDGTWVCRKIL